MKHLVALFPVALYFVVGLISLVMAQKSLLSKKLLPFHEAAAGKSWDAIDKPLQGVIIALLRVGGLGFLVVGLLLLIFPIVNIQNHGRFTMFAVPVIALLYCCGLFWANYRLYKQTGASTPWKGALAAAAIVCAAIVISIAVPF